MQTRKRGAPGSDPPLQQSQQSFNDFSSYAPQVSTVDDISNALGDQYVDWNSGQGMNNMANQYSDQNIYDANLYNSGINGNVGGDAGESANPPMAGRSSQLVRRNPNQQLTTRGRPGWPDPNNNLQPQTTWEHFEEEDERDLEQRALAAKRDAQAKRKQIPPFVQKLSSFLDDGKNTELIRWSDDGRSFIVVDEDEFAKTLIPELFKHNNYASFVRQLNMYGFHKKVGLSDNSMKASENKRKTPSEYYNKYFRRGRPELLWLIQKPKTTTITKRKREDGKGGTLPDSDDESKAFVAPPESQEPTSNEIGHPGSQELTTIPKSELSNLRNELVTLQRQQKVISSVISQIKRQNDQLYQQATAFQALHERHESSINAILTFLATFYNRSLESHGNPNVADMFSHAIPQSTTHQGNVVEMPDIPVNISAGNIPQTRSRRPLALLPAPEVKQESTSPITLPPSSTRSTVSPRPRNQQPPVFRSQAGSVRTDGGLNSTLPANVMPSPGQQDEFKPSLLGNTDDVMSMINAANATSPASTIDFNSALEHYQNANGKAPLTAQQRNDMLSMIANSSGAGNTSNLVTAGANALTDPFPPPVPEVSDITQSQEQLDLLQRLQDEQAQKVQTLADRLGPLSPSGTIPGIHDDTIPPPLPDNWNIDDWLNDAPTDFNHNDSSNYDLGYFNNVDYGNTSGFGDNGIGVSNDELFDNTATQATGGRVESVSSRATTPSRAQPGDDNNVITPARKRKRNS